MANQLREMIVGPEEGPTEPFPLKMGGKVVKGFGRGSKELGIPTANIPVEGVPWIDTVDSGVYFGWAGIQLPADHPDLHNPPPPSTPTTPSPPPTPLSVNDENWRLYPMVMSIGYNPFYKNKVRTAEVHILHKFAQDFYGSEIRISILGYIRPEFDYVSVEALIGDIKTDCEVAGRSLAREAWKKGGEDEYLWSTEA